VQGKSIYFSGRKEYGKVIPVIKNGYKQDKRRTAWGARPTASIR
jgi:hypothetical protein